MEAGRPRSRRRERAGWPPVLAAAVLAAAGCTSTVETTAGYALGRAPDAVEKTSVTGRRLRLHVVQDPSAVAACTDLGSVAGASTWGGPFGEAASDRALAEAADRAARLRADVLLVRSATRGVGGASVEAQAYRCMPDEAAPAAEAAPAPGP